MYGRISFALKTTILLLGIRQKNIALIGIKTGTEFFHHLTGLMGIKVSVEIIADLRKDLRWSRVFKKDN
jgi:hypothetical protein